MDSELACEFLRVAEGDYEAAKCLLRNGFYPQGLFYLQQALEKGLKALLIALGADEEKLKKKLGHMPLGGFCKIWEKVDDKIKEVMNRCQLYDAFNLLCRLYKQNTEVSVDLEAITSLVKVDREELKRALSYLKDYLARCVGEELVKAAEEHGAFEGRLLLYSVTFFTLHLPFEEWVVKLRYPSGDGWTPLSVGESHPLVQEAEKVTKVLEDTKLFNAVEEALGCRQGDA